jgi:quinol monooxygenase YgiN
VFQSIEAANTLVVVQRWQNAAALEAFSHQPTAMALQESLTSATTRPLSKDWRVMEDVGSPVEESPINLNQ